MKNYAILLVISVCVLSSGAILLRHKTKGPRDFCDLPTISARHSYHCNPTSINYLGNDGKTHIGTIIEVDRVFPDHVPDVMGEWMYEYFFYSEDKRLVFLSTFPSNWPNFVPECASDNLGNFSFRLNGIGKFSERLFHKNYIFDGKKLDVRFEAAPYSLFVGAVTVTQTGQCEGALKWAENIVSWNEAGKIAALGTHSILGRDLNPHIAADRILKWSPPDQNIQFSIDSAGMYYMYEFVDKVSTDSCKATKSGYDVYFFRVNASTNGEPKVSLARKLVASGCDRPYSIN